MMIGEMDIIYDKRPRVEEYKALSKVFALKLSSFNLEKMFALFPDVYQDVKTVAYQREKLRLLKL